MRFMTGLVDRILALLISRKITNKQQQNKQAETWSGEM